MIFLYLQEGESWVFYILLTYFYRRNKHRSSKDQILRILGLFSYIVELKNILRTMYVFSFLFQDAKFVEERRKQLQNYLRNVMNKIIQTVPEFTANPKKETLIQLMPFFV